MPFNFRLGKRSQIYNVASKDLLVIPIELLTHECIECTLLSTSTGQECLNNVCQKIGIQQPGYFSLLFRSKKNVDQWVDLSKPLKKQLNKYSIETRLYFRLQYFVPNFHFLSDELSRYHYFCAMKNLVIDGRIACSRDDAILLASFSLQAEFGDYSPERHTVEYLNNFSLFPKSMVTSKIARDVLVECAINAYRNLQGVPPSVAEIYYISEAQRREGYGQEGFPARDLSNGQDVCLGVCIRGIFVVNTDNNTLELFKWMDIANLMHNKKVFTIERYSDKYPKNYSTYNSDYASCIWQTCVEQHQYFMKGIQNAANENESVGGDQQMTAPTTTLNNHSISNIPFMHGVDLFNPASNNNNSTNDNSIIKLNNNNADVSQITATTTTTTGTADTIDFNRIQSVYETVGQDLNTTSKVLKQSPSLNKDGLVANTSSATSQHSDPNRFVSRQRSSTEPLDLHHIKVNCVKNYNLKSGELSNESNLLNSEITSNNSSSTNIPIYENQSNLTDLTYEQKKKLLPPYKNPPDYETFLKHKNLTNTLSQSLSSIPSRLASHNHNNNNNNKMNSSSSSLLISHPNIISNKVSSSTLSVPQLLRQQKHHSPSFAANVYKNYIDLSNLVADKTLMTNTNNAATPNSAARVSGLETTSHRCSLPQNDQFKMMINPFESLQQPLNQLNLQHQRLQKSGMITASSPDLNSLNSVYKRNIQQQIKSNGVQKPMQVKSIRETNEINFQNNQIIKKPHYFTSVPDLSFKNPHLNPDSFYNKKYKTKNLFSFGGKNLRFFWQQNKTGSEPNLLNNFSHSPNCYNLKRSKFSIEKLDFHPMRNNNYNSELQNRPSISYKIDELPENTVEQQQQQQQGSKSENNLTGPECSSNENSTKIQKPKSSQVIYINLNPGTSTSTTEEKTNEIMNVSTINVDNTAINKIDQLDLIANIDISNAKQIKNSRIIVFDKSFDDQDFTKEFELLPRMIPTAKFTTASLPENILKNRFRDILPYELNRVKLTPTKENKHGYINASHVVMTFGSMKQHYIAAQGPLPNTTIDFWQMVFEHNINLIVMVTNFTEAGSHKCFVYLPLTSEPGKNVIRFGDYEITCNYATATLTYISSYLTLTHNGQKRNITHLRYTDWNDHSIPGDMQSFLTFLSEMDAIYRQNNRSDGSGSGRKRSSKILPPILVHCSAGAGRSGVVILCDALLKCLDHNFEPIDIPKALIQLRYQRMISVQHCEQFRFVCQVLSQYLSNSRLI